MSLEKKAIPLIKDEERQKSILKIIPKRPGIYLMKEHDGTVIYVGKAKVLKNRVKQYFQAGPNHSIGTRVMMKHLTNIETISVQNELEALLLEIDMIKKYKPRYNVLMRDDKNYCYLKVTLNEEYPRIFTTRQRQKDKALYLGPYMNTKHITKSLEIVKKIFPYRTCKGTIQWSGEGKKVTKLVELGAMAQYKKNVINKNLGRKTPCLDFHLKRCQAPCVGIVPPEQYQKNIQAITSFLKGKYDDVVLRIKELMQEAIVEKNFEWAAKLRDKLYSIEEMHKKQSVIGIDLIDRDVVVVLRGKSKGFAAVMQIRGGKIDQILYREMQMNATTHESACLEAFLTDHYQLVSEYPKEIYLSHELSTNAKVFAEWFSSVCKSKIHLYIPKRGKKRDLVDIAIQNLEKYKIQNETDFDKKDQKDDLKILQEALHLKKLPKRIECYDISHTQGTNTTASMVVMKNGKMINKHYRRFSVNSVSNEVGEPDDFLSMKEVLLRRLKYLKEEKQKISFKKASKTVCTTIIAPRYTSELMDSIQWHIGALGDKQLYIGIQDTGENTHVLAATFSEEVLPQHIWGEIMLDFLYAQKIKHIYFPIEKTKQDICISIGATKIDAIPEKYKPIITETGALFTWYRKSKARKKYDDSFHAFPDILVVDGGKGQLTMCQQALTELGLSDTICAIGLAKREETIILPDKTELNLPMDNPALRLLIKCRDESHRFAQKYHKEKRTKTMLGK
jgi:excinuclease ABC subunit C